MNPFEDPEANYLVLINAEGQYSLWPTFAAIPAGWDKVYGEASRENCLEFVDKVWQDMRPKSLIAAMEANVSNEA